MFGLRLSEYDQTNARHCLEEETIIRSIYFVLVGLDLLPVEQFPSESLQLLHSVLAGLSVGTHNVGTQLI